MNVMKIWTLKKYWLSTKISTHVLGYYIGSALIRTFLFFLFCLCFANDYTHPQGVPLQSSFSSFCRHGRPCSISKSITIEWKQHQKDKYTNQARKDFGCHFLVEKLFLRQWWFGLVTTAWFSVHEVWV